MKYFFKFHSLKSKLYNFFKLKNIKIFENLKYFIRYFIYEIIKIKMNLFTQHKIIKYHLEFLTKPCF